MKRAYVEPLRAGRLALEQRHLAVVLRAAPGDEIVLFDGHGREARARIVSIVGITLELDVGEPHQGIGGAPIQLVVALLKADKMDLVVQKATELGVSRITPIAAARSVVRLDGDRAAARVDRWAKIAREAARQCGRADAPAIDPVQPPFPAIAGSKILLHEAEHALSLREVLTDGPVAIAVGPEGGFTDEEVALARAAGWTVCGFGARILRAETAALAAVATCAYVLGDLG